MPRNKKKSNAAKNQITKPAAPNDAAKEKDEKPKLTPYEGPDQAFGEYKCENCKRYWTSNVSWANTGQMCKKCKVFVKPFRRFQLESDESYKLDRSDWKKRHPQELCEKCTNLGRYCGNKYKKRRPRTRRS